MWRYGVALAEPDGTPSPSTCAVTALAPRALDYTLAAYAADLAAPARRRRTAGSSSSAHSLGGAAATVAAAEHPAWTRRLVLIDPAIHLDRPRPRRRARRARSDRSPIPTPRRVRAEHPHWHEHDIELKALSAQPGQPVGGRADERRRTPRGMCGMPRPR